MTCISFLSVCSLFAAVAFAAHHADDPSNADGARTRQDSSGSDVETITYEVHVRPLFKSHCFHCHGEDNVREGGLDLRLRRFLLEGGDSGEVIVPGDAGSSALFQRIVDGEMPPDDHQLTTDQIRLIGRWIELGAPLEQEEPDEFDEAEYLTNAERQFWSFQAIRRPVVSFPDDRVISPIDTPIDAFLATELESHQLRFSDEASKVTLIRRLTFDLHGLPPTPSEVTSFVNDHRPDAYERLVDRLLASPRYGERWGRHWLDVAGYADSEGYVDSDPVREWSFRYRDYVIDSFNGDMPLDQFILEQLAGDELVVSPLDQLTNDDIRLLTATGFLRMAPDGTGAGGVDQNVARNEVVAETLNIVSSSLLGLTVGCARCHNHRYDPISQKDYYRLRAIFEPALDWKSWRAPNSRRISLYTDEDRALAAEIEARAQEAVDERQAIQQAHLDRTLEEELVKAPNDLVVALREAYQTEANARSEEQNELLKQYPNIRNINAGSLYLYSQQRARRANEIETVANEKEIALIQALQEQQLVLLDSASQELAEQALASDPSARTPEQQELLDEYPMLNVRSESLSDFDENGAQLVASIRQMAQVCRDTNAQQDLADLQTAIDEIRATIPKEQFIRALTEPSNHTPETFLFRRGNHTQPAEVVEANELNIFQSFTSVEIPSNDPDRQSTGRRLAYARHLTSGDHPLVARVLVNRVWMHHFGRGLVNSPGDFGMLGETPSHPELLDWLASELMDNGWQMKPLHRLIVLSHVYRQSSQRTEQLDEIDPDNRLLARQSMRRLESESVRDSIVFVSGLANFEMGGPPIPVMEDSVGQIVIGREDLDGERKPRESSGLGGAEHRRSVYVQVRRSRPLAMIETFDAPTLAPNCTERSQSNVAPQSLFLMNSEFTARYALRFAERILAEPLMSDRDRIQYAWSLAFASELTEQELERLEQFLNEQKNYLHSVDNEADEQTVIKESWAILCQALLASNRFLYVE